jgi:phosphotransacetylase
MSPREFIAFYRWCATYCLGIAHKFEDPECKAALLSMAQTWRALADQVERARDATHGILHPQSDGS